MFEKLNDERQETKETKNELQKLIRVSKVSNEYRKILTKILANEKLENIPKTLEFDPGSGRTLAACLKHASRTEYVSCTKVFRFKVNTFVQGTDLVADG